MLTKTLTLHTAENFIDWLISLSSQSFCDSISDYLSLSLSVCLSAQDRQTEPRREPRSRGAEERGTDNRFWSHRKTVTINQSVKPCNCNLHFDPGRFLSSAAVACGIAKD